MGTTAEKLSYLNGTKRLLRRRLNSLGANITLDTTFRDYLVWLDRFFDAASAPINIEILGETTQRATNTSTNLIPINDGQIVTDGITVVLSEGGKISVNGTATRDVWIKITNGIEAIYENPMTVVDGQYIDTYGWLKEKIEEFDSETTLYIQDCWGTGTAPSGGYPTIVVVTKRTSGYDFRTNPIENLVIRTASRHDKDVYATSTKDNTLEINCVYLYFPQGSVVNQYFWVQACLTQQTKWQPNYDTLPPSPDNPKTIINKSGTITYTASDGTTFPITLEDDYGDTYDLCGNPDPNGTPERIYYQNGKFYLEKKIKQFTYTGAYGIEETWNRNTGQDVYTGALSDMQYKSIYAISNYFKNAENSNIVDTNTAETYLNDLEFAIHGPNDDSIYLKYNAIQEEQVLDGMSTSGLRTWLSTHNLVVQCGNYEDEPWEINDEWASGLNAQLQAIVDYETKLKIQEKIGG